MNKKRIVFAVLPVVLFLLFLVLIEPVNDLTAASVAADLLLESDLPLEKLRLHYAGQAEVIRQTERTVTLLEHYPLRFSMPLRPDGQYYLVYAWGEGIQPFAALDLRGH